MLDSEPNLIEIAPGLSVPMWVLDFTFSRSGGPGGQNVNKLNTKATLSVLLGDLVGYIGAEAVERLRHLAGSKVTEDDRLLLVSQESRSQQANKADCVEKLRQLILQARVRPKRRKKTKPTYSSKLRRLKEKKHRGEIKRDRQRGSADEHR